VSEDAGPEDVGPEDGESTRSPLRRTIDLCVANPVGVAASVVEELPELLAEGRRRVELQLGNALVVGRFVVAKKQRDLSERLDGLLGNGSQRAASPSGNGTVAPPAPPPGPDRPAPDPAAAAVVAGALADYDTLSASQVVPRLESLGPEELQAVQRYEASTRNRRTVLNRAGQLLEERLSGPSGP
jgi:hypothetical protein